MAEDERLEAEKQDEDEVEGHWHGGRHGREMTSEPQTDDDSSDDVEAHGHGGRLGRS